jgi:dTDP-4-dehydrorhamnose 3,5-epimerase
MIEGVKIIPLKQFPDERGKIMQMLKSTDPHFTKFGDMSFSIAFPGVVKGWHKRKTMTSNIAVPFGKVKWVLYDDRENSKTKGEVMEIFLGEDNYNLLSIPPGITSGYKTYGVTHSIVANCTNEAHDDGGKINIDPFNNDIPYDWNLKHR